jgi:hypothetical protein
MTVMLNGYRYSAEIVELMDMVYTYNNKYTQQFEKFYGDPMYREVPYEVLDKVWGDMEAAVKLLKELWGPEFYTNMNDYAIEVRRKGNK